MFGTTISSTSNKNQSVSTKHVSGTRAKMKYHTLSTSSIASEGKKSTLTIYADMDLNHDKLEAELVAARRELESVQKALHQQTQRCRELVAEFSRKLQSKDIQIQSERQLRDQQLTKVLRALLLFEARLVQEQKIIRQQLNEKDNIIKYQQIQIRKLQVFNENYCQSSNLESLESSSEFYGFQESNNRFNTGDRVSNFESLDSSSEIYATVSEKDYNHDRSTSSEDTGNKTDCDSLPHGGTYIKNKHVKVNDVKRTKKYINNRKSTGTYIESLRRRESCIDSSSNDEEPDIRNLNGNVNESIEKVSQRIENIFTDTKNVVTASHKFSEKIDNLHGIKNTRLDREDQSDEAYTTSSISGSTSSTSTNYCSPGDIRGSYEPNGNFNCNSSTKSESEITTTYSESTKNNEGDNVSLEIYELNGDGDIYNAGTLDKNQSNNNMCEKIDRTDKDNNVMTVKNKNIFQNSTDNRFIFDKNDSEANENWYASASDQEEDHKCEIYKNNPVLECMNQILLHNIHDPINSPPKSPVPITKSKSPKRVKFFDENNHPSMESKSSNNETNNSISKKLGNCTNSISPASSQESNYYETPIQGVANVYEVPQSIYSNDYEQILINCNDGFQNWSSPVKNSPPGKIENLQEKEVSRMAQQKLSVAKSGSFDNLDNKNNYYYVDMDSRVIDNRTGQSIIRKCKLSRTPPALPPKPANLVSKYKIQGKKLNENQIDPISNSIDMEPDYCSISELNLAVESDVSNVQGSESTHSSSNMSLYDQIIANASNTQQNKILRQSPNERSPSTPSNNTHTKSKEPKSSKTLDIPKLPQVSEIIIPSESESEAKDECITQDNYIKNNSQMLKQKSSKISSSGHDKYKSPIQIGVSVSSLITGFNNQHILSEINNRKSTSPKNKLPEHVFSNFEKHQNYEKQPSPSRSEISKSEIPSFEKFDLSQNFEEFRLDDCEIGEEYHISIESDVKEVPARTPSELKKNEHSVEKEQNMNNEAAEKSETRNLNSARKNISVSVENILGLKTLPGPNNRNGLQKTAVQQSVSNVSPVKRSSSKVPVLKSTSSFHHHQDNYEQFLECTGLSSKSILTPSRLLSNHKAMLKPKDVKLRDRVRSTTIIEKHGNTVKYYSEPYL